MVEMTEEEEKLLADGRNFEHSEGAVHTSKLEILFQIKRNIEAVRAELMRVGKDPVYFFKLLNIEVLTKCRKSPMP